MSSISRREFLAGTAAAGTALFVGRLSSAAPAARKITSGTDLVTLGRSGVKSTVLGIGTGTHGGREERELGPVAFTRLVRHAYDRGIRYIDTADNYRMHGMVRVAIQKLPREQLFIQTKTPSKDAKGAKADIDRYRLELGVDYIDSLLMHCMRKDSFPGDMRPVMDVLTDAKEKGIVHAVGVSCHGWPSLAASVGVDWIDVQLARINPFGTMMDGKSDAVAELLKKMHDKGRGVIGMKIYGETGFGSAEKRLQSLRYVLGLGSVDAFTIGFVNTRQIDETLDLIRKALA